MDQAFDKQTTKETDVQTNNWMRTACFADMTRHHWVIGYRRFVVSYCFLLDWAVGCQKA